MKVKINGREEILEQEKINVGRYLKEKGIQPEIVAVEVNLNIIDKAKYAETFLREGDEVEIVKMVGGG